MLDSAIGAVRLCVQTKHLDIDDLCPIESWMLVLLHTIYVKFEGKHQSLWRTAVCEHR